MIQKIINKNIDENEKLIKDIFYNFFQMKSKKREMDLKFPTNFQIIDENIYRLLMEIKYIIMNPIKMDLYFIGNNKLLLKKSDKFKNNNICDEIGFINNQNVFIPEYILYYKKDINISSLNLFLKEKFIKESVHKNKHIKIEDDNESVIGFCFSLNNINEEISDEEYNESPNSINVEENVPSKYDDTNNNENIKINNPSIQFININKLNLKINEKIKPKIWKNFLNIKKDQHSKEKDSNSNKMSNPEQIMDQIGFNMKRSKEIIFNEQENENKEKISEYIKDIIEIILLMHNFEKDLNKKIAESSNKTEYKIDEGILINKEWIDNFKNIYLTEEIKEYLKVSTSDNITVDIEYIYSNELKNKKDYWKKIQKSKLKLESKDFTLEGLTQMEKNTDIFYGNNFYIINSHIYSKFIKNFKIDNSEELNKEENKLTQYIINNGKIIISYEYNINIYENEIDYYNILISEKNKDNDQIDVITIQCYENNKDKRDSQFNRYTKIKYSLGEIVGEIDGNIVIKRMVEEENNLDEDISTLFEIFFDIFTYRNLLIQKLRQKINESKEKEYYIIDNNWMNSFLEFFHFNEFISLFKKNNNGLKDSLSSSFRDNETINKIIKEKNKFDINIEQLKVVNKNFGENNIEFINNFELINETLKNLIEKFIPIKIETKAKFLFFDDKAFVYFNDEKNKNILLFGNFNEGNTFNTNILIKFNEGFNKDFFINKIKGKKLSDIIIIFIGLGKNEFILLKQYDAIAYDINIDEEFKKILRKKIVKSKSHINVIKRKDLMRNNINKPDNSQKSFERKLEGEEEGKEEEREEEEEEEEEEKENIEKENVEEEIERKEKGDLGEENIKLKPFDENQIKVLIKYYFFIIELKKAINDSSSQNKKFNSYNCYMINYDWMENYKKFYLYDKLVKIIEKVAKEKIDMKKINDIKYREQIVFENLSKEYIKEIINKEKMYDETYFDRQKNIEFSFKNLNNKTEYPTNFEIISSEIFELIRQRNDKNLKLYKKEFIINSKKIIIKYISNSKSLLELLIGRIDFSTYQFVLQIIFKYKYQKKSEDFNRHYDLLKSSSIEKFLSCKTKDDKLIEWNQSVGKIYIIKEQQQNKIETDNNEVNEIEGDIEYADKINMNQNKINIKFMFKLYLFTKKLKYELNNNFESIEPHRCFLIKKELIDKYNDCYKFDSSIKDYEEKIFKGLTYEKILKIFSWEKEKKEEFYDSLIQNYKEEYINNKNYDLNFESVRNKNLLDTEPTLYNGDKKFIYYENCLLSREPLPQSEDQKKYLYAVFQNKIILIFNNENINIGILDYKSNKFIPEAIIKFTNFKEIASEMKIFGINQFESYFNEIFKNTNNYIAFIKSKNEEVNKEIQINNFIGQNHSKIKQETNITNIDISANKRKMEMKKNQEQQRKKLQSLKIILSIMIDSEIVKRKMNKSLKESREEKYYLLNYGWFINYIKINQFEEIFEYLVKNQIVESYLNKKIEDNIIDNDINIDEIILNLDKNIINKEFNVKINISSSSKNVPLKVDLSNIYISRDDYIVYLKDFILISPKTENLLSDEFPSHKMDALSIIFGDDKIFVKILTTYKKILQICQFNNSNFLEPTMFFNHKNKSELNQNIQLLLSTGFNDYQKYYLLFNEDYISPIFDQNNKSIGQAFRYHKDINNYSKFVSREEKVKCLMGLYFSNYKLKTKFNKKIKAELYFIINEKYLKEIDIYSQIGNELNKIDLSNEINEAISNGDNEDGFDSLLQGKKIAIIIKKILSKQDNNLSNNNHQQPVIPNLTPFSCKNIDIFFFEHFKLLEESFNNKLEQNEITLFRHKQNNIVKCYIIETYILIDISKNNKSDSYGYFTEVCEINNENILKPIYLLAYYDENYFIKHMNYIFQNLQFTFQNFLESLDYSQGNGINLQLDDRIDIGILFKLSGEFPIQNQIINNNITINNINNNNNPNININFSFSPLFVSNITNNINNNAQKRIHSSVTPFKKRINSIDEEFENPPLVGLKNVGATCYMNATLQCFCNLKKFVNYFKYKLKAEKLEEFKYSGMPNLTTEFKYLIENIWRTNDNNYIIPKYNTRNSNNKYFIPKKFKEAISKMNPLFEGVHANDAKDLVNFLIMTLHDELNQAPKKKDLNESNLYIDQSNREIVLKTFIQSFKNDHMSLISDLFYAMTDSVTECLNCHNRKYNFQIYFFLIFPLEEVRKYKMQNLYNSTNQNMMFLNPMNQMPFQQNFIFPNNNQSMINSVNLDDCFRYNQKIEHFIGENAMYCNFCRNQYPADNQTLLTTGPEILIIILNRGKGIEFKVKCEFVLQLNLYEYIEMKNTGYMYDLVGVVTHMGESNSSGHFIAYCKSPIDKNWYQYNDDLVFPVNNFVNDVINYAMPYILFYQKQQYN